MNCIEINEKMVDLFDDKVSREMKEEFFSHFKECPDCRKLYDEMSEVMSELQPRVAIHAGRNLQARILEQASQSDNPYRSRRIRMQSIFTPTWKKVAVLAAALIMVFVLFPLLNRPGWVKNNSLSASTLLDNSMRALADAKSVYMEFNVRTTASDNFDFINVNEGFVEHKLWKVSDPAKWRIEKPGRTVVMDGKNQYLYCHPVTMALKGNPDAGFIGWMHILLDPGDILYKEKENARTNGSKFKSEIIGNSIVMTVKSDAMGDFSNSYMLNTSIPESNNKRVYTFDKSTNLLRSLEVYVYSGDKEVEVLELKTIKYNEPVDNANFTITLPDNVNWVSATEMYKATGISGVTSEQLAKQFLTACHDENWEKVRQFMPGFMNFLQLQFAIKTEYGGLTILSIGKSFKSGNYPGEFVPYEIKKKNGSIKKWNLAIRNDNPEKKWVLDGGF